ncbi:MAG: patatin-like phospholipase family protein [Deltaproteobacteria bacterium]|nr:patatin-like phospholipase family protein [Deltaproteobacteria bacterium]
MSNRFTYPVVRVLVLCQPAERARLAAEMGLAKPDENVEVAEPFQVHRVIDGTAHKFLLRFVHRVEDARQALRREYYNVMVVDAAGSDCAAPSTSLVHELFTVVRNDRTIDPPWRWDRTVVLLPDSECRVAMAFEMGRLGVGSYQLRPSDPDAFFEGLWRVVERRIQVGKIALCLAGGGVEGLIFEMGVLQALDVALDGRGVLDFDIYCGISAGAILAATLVNGVPPDEFSRAFQRDSTAVAPVDQSVIFDFDFKEYLSRLGHFVYGLSRLKKGPAGAMSLYLRSVPVGFFAGVGIEKHIRKELSRAGRTSDFRQLDKELYIGATDQDSWEHIVFGDKGWDDVPIHEAVRASMALSPFYSPKWIRGRWFVDGSFTRTSELDVAVSKGATLVIIADPLVPIRSTVSGYVKAKGGVFSSIQGLKALVHTRFSEGMGRALEQYPAVDFFVFKPEQDDMRLMSGSPLKYHYRMEIERIAFQRTLERLFEEFPRYHGEWQRHGLILNYDRIEQELTKLKR